MKNKNYFFEFLHPTHNIKMNKRTMDDILKTFDYVLVRNGINPDVDSPNSKNIYRKRERNWLASLNGDKGVKIADLPPQKTLDVYFYHKGKNMHKSAKMEVEK